MKHNAVDECPCMEAVGIIQSAEHEKKPLLPQALEDIVPFGLWALGLSMESIIAP